MLGFGLSVAYIPRVVPPSLALEIGVLISVYAPMLPTVIMNVTAVLPLITVALVVCLIFATIVLAAGTVSSGLFVGIYAILTLCCGALYFGKAWKVNNNVASVYISMAGLLGTSLLAPVQEGGLAAVGALWTEKGTENDAALFRNFFINMCWANVCVTIACILPPFRTSRRYISRGLYPAVFKHVAAVLSGKNVSVQALAKMKSTMKVSYLMWYMSLFLLAFFFDLSSLYRFLKGREGGSDIDF